MTAKWHKVVVNQIRRGECIALDVYNDTGHSKLLPTLPACYGCIGRVGTTLIFEERKHGNDTDQMR